MTISLTCTLFPRHVLKVEAFQAVKRNRKTKEALIGDYDQCVLFLAKYIQN